MTMPSAAAAVREMDSLLPTEMTNEQLAEVIKCFRYDLGDDTIDFIDEAVPRSLHCECGAVHLKVDEPKLSEAVRRNLFRLVASPFGAVMAQLYGFEKLRFGWEGLESLLPNFVLVADRYQARLSWGADIPDDALAEVIATLKVELPGVIEIAEASAKRSSSRGTFYSYVVRPDMVGGKHEWDMQVQYLMLACATPARKFIDEYLLRTHGVQGGAVNCCIYSTMPATDSVQFERLRWQEQVKQQLTPDC